MEPDVGDDVGLRRRRQRKNATEIPVTRLRITMNVTLSERDQARTYPRGGAQRVEMGMTRV